ncbi:hypothetical protein QBC47DRAFT_393680 [Echria macrotheca]|uniref:C2H2-type domain-containing protein n=1 Tax=Echria macrotheca TaxID=438768 RepID=A0AAJ0B2Q4_9PEZI|nr:hypothetical protein QBC47DRAFT_393680 [Echria macrotheca]
MVLPAGQGKGSPKPGRRPPDSPSDLTSPEALANESDPLSRDVDDSHCEDSSDPIIAEGDLAPASPAESGFQSIFALQVPVMAYVPTQDRSRTTSCARTSLPATKSVTPSAPVLPSMDASAVLEPSNLSTRLSRLNLSGLDGPDDEISESGTDSSDALSDIASNTGLAIMEAFQTAVAPLRTQLLSVLIYMRDETVDRIGRRLEALIAPGPHGMRQHGAGQYSSSGASASGLPNGHRNPGRGLGSSRKSQQLGDRNDDGDDSGADDDNEGTQKHSLGSGSGSHAQPRFACVFLKRYPDSKRLTGPCYGPGWVDVHRVKEHILRKHKQPGFMCLRCRVNFDTEADLARHVQRDIPCELRKPPREQEILFITQDQEKQLKKRSSRKIGDRERWENVFRVVFPDVDVDQIPSPYHVAATSSPRAELTIVHSFRDFLLAELPSRFSREVVRVLQARAVPMTSEIERDVAEVCRKEMHDISDGFISMFQVNSPEPYQPAALTSEPTSTPVPSSSAGDPVVIAPLTFATDGGPAQSLSEWSSWGHDGSHYALDSFSMQPSHTFGGWGYHSDAGAGVLSLDSLDDHDRTQEDSLSYWFQEGDR